MAPREEEVRQDLPSANGRGNKKAEFSTMGDESFSSSSSSNSSSNRGMEVPSGNGNGDGTGTATLTRSKDEGFFLRWSRIRKTVEVQDPSNGGALMTGSITGSVHSRFKGSGNGNGNRNGRSGNKNGNAANNANNANKKTKTTKTKDILCEVSGYAAPGEILACMGPSGSGKTSLLNTLSGRSTYQSGVISINGQRVTPATMKQIMAKTAYIKQQDIFFEHLTVEDQLTYTALLRLPADMPREQKLQEVQRIMKLLRLTKVQENQIRMCSGGEKKRVNIGTELLTDPKIILLDEPTSGLDSTSAVSLLTLLKSLAKDEGKTVLTTIHQPSSQVFRSFDRLLMISEGYVVYFGNPVDSLEYLRKQNLACPPGYNAADHWMDLLVKEHLDEHEQQQENNNGTNKGSHNQNTCPRLQLQMAWDREAVAEQMDAALIEEEDNDGNSNSNSNSHELFLIKKGGSSSKYGKYNTSWATQYRVLIHRSLKNSRSSIFTPLNMMKSVAIGLVAGFIWWQMPFTEKTVSDRSSWFFFTMTYWVFDSMFNALMSFPAEKVVILKERASASYHLSAYFMAKTTSDAPVRLVLPFLYMTTSFWMAGIDDRFGVFLASTGCTLLSVLAGESLGLLVGASISAMDKALTVMTISTLTLMLLGGFFVENIPSFVKWARFLSPFKYAFDGSLQMVFDRDVPCDGSGALENLCRGKSEGYAASKDVLDTLGVQGSISFNVAMLIVISLLARYLAYLALRRQKGVERS